MKPVLDKKPTTVKSATSKGSLKDNSKGTEPKVVNTTKWYLEWWQIAEEEAEQKFSHTGEQRSHHHQLITGNVGIPLMSGF